MARVSVIDDMELMRDSLATALRGAGHDVRDFADPVQAVKAISADHGDVVICDLKMPEMDGIAVLRALQESQVTSPVVMMTAYGTIPTAVEAMKLGAFDYIQKPFDADRIGILIDRAVNHSRLRRQNEALRQSVDDMQQSRCLVGESLHMQKLRRRIEQVATSDATVLITGESGTGKELVARQIHSRSRRNDSALLCLNCAALSSSLLESELFGHEKGAFTGADRQRKGRFELADGGTLLLDEVSEIPETLQAKLLRVLQEREFERVGSSSTLQVDVRVLATTNRDLARWIDEGRFRDDLYYRLSVLPVHVPPLRDRVDDVPMLANYFLERIGRREGRDVPNIESSAMKVLTSYHWPGNVREMENIMERASVLAERDRIDADLLQPWLGGQAASVPTRPAQGNLLEDMERDLILKTLAEHDGHRERTARALGIGVRTLGLKLKRWREEGRAEIAPGAQVLQAS